jgi:hypothetical protein
MTSLFLARAILVGLFATLAIDAWAVFLRRAFDIRSLNYCLLGRWVLSMGDGVFVHRNINDTPPKSLECPVGWTAHYSIGAGFGLVFALLVSASWFARPTLLPALLFGIVTVLMPFFTLQPALGLGIASSKAPHPTRARLKSLGTHMVFGLGLYLAALLLRRLVAD